MRGNLIEKDGEGGEQERRMVGKATIHGREEEEEDEGHGMV